MKRNWRRSVHELDTRLQKANELFDKEFPNVYKSSEENKELNVLKMPGSNSSYTENVIRDKNTIVQITVHTKPKDKENKTEHNFREPTIQSKHRSRSTNENQPPRSPRARSRSNSQKIRKTKKESPRRQSKKSSKQRDIESSKKNIDEVTSKEKSSKKDITEVLKDLKEIIQSSGVKDVYEFFQEMEDGSNRRKSAPEVMSGKSKNSTKASKPSSGSAAIKLTAGAQLEKKDEDIEKQEMREKAKADNEKLIMEINKLKAEVMRYKSEFDKCQVQLKIAKDSNESFQTQVVEMKQLITKLTGNNKNLVQLVSDRAAQDEQLMLIERENKKLNQQLESQNKNITEFQSKISEQEQEITRLRSLRADINAQLLHGLEGLEIPRPASSLPNNLLNRTNDILGNTILKPNKRNINQSDNNKNERSFSSATSNTRPPSQSSDSAIDDPNSEKLNLPLRPVFHAPPPPREDPPPPLSARGPTPSQSPSRVAPPPPVRDVSLPTVPTSRQYATGVNNDGKSGPGTPSTQPYPSTQSSLSKPGGYIRQPQFRIPQSSMYSNSPPTRQVSSRLRQESQELPDDINLMTGAVSSTMVSRRTSRNLFQANTSRAASSTLMTSILTEDHQIPENVLEKEVDNDKHEKDIPTNRFAPVQLDMEETGEPDDLDGISGQTKSTPATVIHQNQQKYKGNKSSSDTPNSSTSSDITALKNMKPNLESKVEDFLARLRQDSFNYSIPQAQSYQGASFHLSLSGDDLQDLSRDTTLTEGKFRRGLDSSIDVLSQE